jgi:hypothetical protein
MTEGLGLREAACAPPPQARDVFGSDCRAQRGRQRLRPSKEGVRARLQHCLQGVTPLGALRAKPRRDCGVTSGSIDAYLIIRFNPFRERFRPQCPWLQRRPRLPLPPPSWSGCILVDTDAIHVITSPRGQPPVPAVSHPALAAARGREQGVEMVRVHHPELFCGGMLMTSACATVLL